MKRNSRSVFPDCAYNVIMIVSLIILMFAGHISDSLSRLAAAYFFFLNIVAMTVERFVIKRIAYRVFNSSGNKRKLIIIADEASYDDVRENFNPAYTFDIVGWFRASQLFANGKVKDDTITAETMDISSALVTNEFDDVFIYIPLNFLSVYFENITSRRNRKGIFCDVVDFLFFYDCSIRHTYLWNKSLCKGT